MATYADNTDVQARIPYRTIGASSKPTATQVELYITFAEEALSGALLAGGCTLPTSSDILGGWITDYAEGVTRQAYASAGGDGGNDDGKDLIEGFKALLEAIRLEPAYFCAMINGGSDAPDAALGVRAYVLDNDDDKTIEDGDFGPIFDRDWVD